MNPYMKIFVMFLALLIVQVLVCNHIFLFGVALPVIFIYVILSAPLGMSREALLSIAFLLGFLVDVCSDTPGINALCCTIMAAMQRPLFYAYIQHDDKTQHLVPSLFTMQPAAYLKYLLTFTFIYCLLYFAIEYFSVANVKEVVLMSVFSTLLSFLLMLGIDCLISSKREKRL